MKRCWFGAGLLVVLLIIGLTVTWGMRKIHTPIAGGLRLAAECARQGDWQGAEDFSRQAEASWETWAHLRACFADHTPTEEVDAELAAMAAARRGQETGDFCAACAKAATMVEAVGEAHALSWWNLL